jgi:hypothetical protein
MPLDIVGNPVQKYVQKVEAPVDVPNGVDPVAGWNLGRGRGAESTHFALGSPGCALYFNHCLRRLHVSVAKNNRERNGHARMESQ